MADTRDLLVKIKGDTKDFESAMNGVTKHSGEAGLSFGKMAGAVAAGQAIFSAASSAIRTASTFIEGSVKQYQEAEAASKELSHAVLDVSHATDAQLKATNDLADSLSRKGVLDDDVIRKGLAQLSTFGLTNDSVQKLAGSMADLTVNQFGVKASGEQAVTAANIMAKALNGNFSALEKMGIHLTDTQRKLIKFGNETERVNTVNEVLAANLRTNQATALQTSEGKIAHLSVQYGNLRESIGKVVTDAMLPFISKAVDFMNKVDWEAVINRSVQSLKDLWGNLREVYNQVFKVVDAIFTYLQPKFVALWHTIQEIMPTLQRLWKEVLAPIAKVIGEALVFALGLAVDAINAFLTVMKPVIDFLLNNKPVLVGFTAAFVALAVAMKFNEIAAAFSTAMATVRGAVASTQALIASPVAMGGVAVAGVLADIGLVYQAVKTVQKAIQDVNDAASSAQGASSGYDQALAANKKALAEGRITKEQYAKHLQSLSQGWVGHASGGDVNAGEPIVVGERGQEVFVPKSDGSIVPNHKLNQGGPSGGNVNITVNMGMYAGMPIEKRQIAMDLYKELLRAGRAQGVNTLPLIGSVGVQ